MYLAKLSIFQHTQQSRWLESQCSSPVAKRLRLFSTPSVQSVSPARDAKAETPKLKGCTVGASAEEGAGQAGRGSWQDQPMLVQDQVGPGRHNQAGPFHDDNDGRAAPRTGPLCAGRALQESAAPQAPAPLPARGCWEGTGPSPTCSLPSIPAFSSLLLDPTLGWNRQPALVFI